MGKRRSKADKVGAGRIGFDQAAALEALAWSQGGEQLGLPGLPALRFAGVQPAPDDADDGQAGRSGRPPGSKNALPDAFRRYLLARYGSVVEGLVQDATRPVAAIAAELVQAYQAVCAAAGLQIAPIGWDQILELVQTAAQIRLTARRYAAPYQHSPAPTQLKVDLPRQRVAIGLFTQAPAGQVDPTALVDAENRLAQLLGVDPSAFHKVERNQQVIDGESRELDASELDAPSGNHARKES